MHRQPRQRTARGALNVRGTVAVGAIGVLSALAGNLETRPPTPVPAAAPAVAAASSGPSLPLVPVAGGQPVDWWFAYKFSGASFPMLAALAPGNCSFGGLPRRDYTRSSQKYAFASSANPVLADGPGLLGTGPGDPLGATFGRIYSGNAYFVVWNDQFYNDPERNGSACDDKQCGKPWGHSKGVLAWDKAGNGVLIQVTTPSWPGAASARVPRAAGNTLGCISNDDDTAMAQDFFALKLNRDDLLKVLDALATSSVSTDINNPQIVNKVVDRTPLPDDIARKVSVLGQVSPTVQWQDTTLSTGVRLIAKPSALHVPPWQFVSSLLGGENLLTATWWASPRIGPSRSLADVKCWHPTLPTVQGKVDIALSSQWEGARVAFTGGPNHAKIGVSGPGGHGYAIFGDLNQQGTLGTNASDHCDSSQNGRGGMFFVITNPQLHDGVARLISGTQVAYGG